MIAEDIELKFSNDIEENEIDYLLKIIYKKQERKEIEKRVTAREEIQVVSRLLSYYKWRNKKAKQDIDLLFNVINLYCKIIETDDPELKKYLYHIINTTEQWTTKKSYNNSLFEQLEKDISQLIALHKYAYLYEWLKELIETGSYQELKESSNTLDLDIEEANKSKELNSIVAYFKTIKEKFEKIGYKVPNISFLVKRYAKNYSTFNPISSNKVNKIYIDIDAYKELANNKKALEFCLVIEIINIISNVNKIGEFIILANWNKTYKENEVIPFSRFFLKKLLPNYYKKVTLNESIFNY